VIIALKIKIVPMLCKKKNHIAFDVRVCDLLKRIL